MICVGMIKQTPYCLLELKIVSFVGGEWIKKACDPGADAESTSGGVYKSEACQDERCHVVWDGNNLLAIIASVFMDFLPSLPEYSSYQSASNECSFQIKS